jgi:hypothetical protein
MIWCAVVTATSLAPPIVRAGQIVPGAPSFRSAIAGNSQAFLDFTAPAYRGSDPIGHYHGTCNPGGVTGASATSPIRVVGLQNGVAYSCTVSATSLAGTSAPSTAASVTPSASAALSVIGVVSRKTHGVMGPFDLPIAPVANAGSAITVEPRATGTGHKIIFLFNDTVQSFSGVTVTDEASSPVSAIAAAVGAAVEVVVASLADRKRLTIVLSGVNGTLNSTAALGFAVGDFNNSFSVTTLDVSGVKAFTGQLADAGNFKFDVNASGTVNAADVSAVKARLLGAVVPPQDNPIMFATQIPLLNDVGSRVSTFGNHVTSPDNAPRGGDLMIRYPDGTLRNLTQEAGYGMSGFQGANAIAVREPSVHWSGTKAVFSMVIGSPSAQFEVNPYFWQMYEVTGLAKGQTAAITKIPSQPPNYNNVSPIYGTDDRIIFTSDRPRDGQAHLYPQLDEYESMPTVTGIWSLDPVTGNLRLLNHSPSGAFSPSIDSFGRVVFTRWDHLQQDQQADLDRASPANPPNGSFNYADETPAAPALTNRNEFFPETRANSVSPVFGSVNGYTSNFFTPWQINEDGTDEETLNHIGRHELQFGYMPRTFTSDPALQDYTNDTFHANQKTLRMDGGLFNLREDPLQPGTYFAISSREFGSFTSDQIVKLTGSPTINPEGMVLTDLTPADGIVNGAYASPKGRFRNPLPTTTNKLIASYTPATAPLPALLSEFRLRPLTLDPATGFYAPGASLTGGITKSVSWWTPDTFNSFSGMLWEIEPVEVVARQRPTRAAPPLEAPEQAILTEESVSEAALRAWLVKNDLALIVTRDQTSRDRADLQQPFNLRVPGGGTTLGVASGKIYDIAHFQIFQADLIRGYPIQGRRVIAQPLHEPKAANVPNPVGPPGSVKIASDGSTAAFVPARRALAWQTTDASGEPVVRERIWVTMQPGEIRVCASCHGANTKNQAGLPTPTNKPEALRTLLRAWKLLP